MANFSEESLKIQKIIEGSKRVLLHCHPFPDPDSIGSVLAMTAALKQMGKEVYPILGGFEYPDNMRLLPNIEWINKVEYSSVNPAEYDLFIILDSSTAIQATGKVDAKFPDSMNTVVIDHHKTNEGFGKNNLIDPEASSTCEVLFRLFGNWKIKIDQNMALYLLLGIYADTGGFMYQNASAETMRIVTELVRINPNYHKYLFELENNKKPIELEMMALALSSIEKYFEDKFVITQVPYSEVQKRNLTRGEAAEGLVGDTLRRVVGWDVVASLVEVEPEVVVVSLRTRDEKKYDVSSIVKLLSSNGGGHRGAAGATINASLTKAKEMLLETMKKEFRF